MKAVQVMMDEELLAALDATHEVREKGRSRVLRDLVGAWLRSHREREIDEAYQQAYTAHPPDEFVGWEEAATWPEP